MQQFRPAAERGQTRTGWLDSRHGFSFGHFHDPAWMGWGVLRVLNEDRVAPGAGFPPHGHANMEILSYVVSGALAHRDSTGAEGVVGAGEWQWMSAGHGVEHSEFNASETEPVHFLQVWIQPERVNTTPAHARRRADRERVRGRWVSVASPDGADGSLAIRQQAWVRCLSLGADERAAFPLQAGRRYWLQLVAGHAIAGGRALAPGDAIGYADESGELSLAGAGEGIADLVLFDLPG